MTVEPANDPFRAGVETNSFDDAPRCGAVPPPPSSKEVRDAVLRRTEEQMDLWSSAKMGHVKTIIREAARVDVTVLVTGETGTGKDVVARSIHQLSSRRTAPFVKVNCAAMPRDLLETELFGHERGAFTGAHQLNIGKFEAADGGTLFLDEIGDLHAELQGKLLHVLQDGEFSRVGGKSTVKVDVRTIAATNQNLERAVVDGRFRQDLYYRLNVIQFSVPPLRERVEEIPGLIGYFVDLYAKRFFRESFALSPMALNELLRRPYPGNVRELENLIKRMIVLGEASAGFTGAESPSIAVPMAQGAAPPAEPTQSLRDIVRRASAATEREVIARVLDQSGWNRVRAAKTLKISYRALLYKMKHFGLNGGRASRRAVSWGPPQPEGDGG